MKSLTILCIFLIACCANLALAKVIITHASTESNNEFVTASIQVKNKTQGTFVDVSLDMHKSINGKILVSVEIFKKINGEYKSLVVTTVRNICDVLSQKQDTPAIDMAVQLLSQFGTVPSDCPIEKGHAGIKDFQIPDFLISPFVTGGQYQLMFLAEDHNGATPVNIMKATIQVTMIKDANSNPENIKKLLKLLAN